MWKVIFSSLLLTCVQMFCGLSLANDQAGIVLSAPQVSVTAEDIDRYILENIPVGKRAEVLRSQKIYREMAENLYIVRSLAAEAETDESFDKEQAEWAARIAYERWLVSQYRNNYIHQALEKVDWEAAAREVYTAEPERFQEPEQVSVSHILIKSEGRSDEESFKLASDLRDRAVSGEEFTSLTSEFSEDPSVKSNQGDMGYFARGKMVPPFEEAAFAMQKEGEISEVVKTDFGYHVIRFNGRKPAAKKPFDEVKGQIIAELKKSLGDQLWQDKIIAIRSSPDIKFNEKALKELAAKYKESAATAD